MKNWLEDLNKTLGLGLILAFIVFLIRGYYGILGEIGHQHYVVDSPALLHGRPEAALDLSRHDPTRRAGRALKSFTLHGAG